MKTIYISIALFFAAMITANAQEPLLQQRENRRPVLIDDVNAERILNVRQQIQQPYMIEGLSAEQRKQIKALQVELQKKMTQLNSQLREKQTLLQTLETQDVVSIKAINKNIDEQAKLLAKQMKLQAEYKQKIRALLDDEQRARFDMRGE